MRPLVVTGTGTTVHIRQSRFVGNNVAPSGIFGGALAVTDTARATIQSSSFLSNKAIEGGAILASNRAQVNLTAMKATRPGERLWWDSSSAND